jgi:Carbohydrate family 9 binding domain-like
MTQSATILAGYVNTSIDVSEFAHPRWRDADPALITRLWSGQPTPPGSHAEARILWTNDSLLLKFVCKQNQPLVINQDPKLEEKTIGLWDRDVCEVFLAPRSDQPEQYFEFEAAPTGEWVDLAIKLVDGKKQNDFDFHSGMTTAASFSHDQLTIGIRIPWSKFIPRPEINDEWGINLFRCVGLGNERYVAWQPTFTGEPNFHVPSRFGKLRFV